MKITHHSIPTPIRFGLSPIPKTIEEAKKRIEQFLENRKFSINAILTDTADGKQPKINIFVGNPKDIKRITTVLKDLPGVSPTDFPDRVMYCSTYLVGVWFDIPMEPFGPPTQ